MMAAGTRPAGAPHAEEQIEDRELLLRVRNGDAAAFEALVQRYLPRARVLARRLMHDPDDADDLVQDAFLRALGRIATFDVDRAFGPGSRGSWSTRASISGASRRCGAPSLTIPRRSLVGPALSRTPSGPSFDAP
jgi:hypothetical protein